MELGDGTTAEVSQVLWDIEGSQDGESLTDTYLRGASGALVVGDVSRADVLETMEIHARRFLAVLPGRPLVFALNKADLLAEGAEPDLGKSLTDGFGGEAIYSSAATGDAVPTLFRLAGASNPGNRNLRIVVVTVRRNGFGTVRARKAWAETPSQGAV